MLLLKLTRTAETAKDKDEEKEKKSMDISEQNIWIHYLGLRQIVSSENLGYFE